METYTIEDLLKHRKTLAMNVCGIFDEEEIGNIEPISYLDKSNPNHTFVHVWMFGNKKIFSAFVELIPGSYKTLEDMKGQSFFDIYRFKNIHNIRLDDYGMVIELDSGKKLELLPNSFENAENFKMSARGLIRLWDDYE